MKPPKQHGFTIVELLIVIVVIAILAAISIVAYNGIQQRARVTTAKSELKAVATKAELFRVDNSRYPNTSNEWQALFADSGMPASVFNGNKTFVICYRPAGDMYAVVAGNPVSSTTNGATNYMMSSSGGMQDFAWDTSITGTLTSDRMCRHTPLGTTYSGAWAHNWS